MSRGSSQVICCDIIARLSIDVNLLIKEANNVIHIQKYFTLYKQQQKSLLKELEIKDKMLHIVKAEYLSKNASQISSAKINEFTEFLNLVWENAKQFFEKKLSKLQYLTKDGIPLIPYIYKLIEFTEHIYSNYYNKFLHPSCRDAFLHLSNQICNVLYPELSQADIFEQSFSFVIWSVPFLINLVTVFELFAASPTMDICSLHNLLIPEESKNIDIKISRHFLPTKILSSLLKGDLLGEEYVDTVPIVRNSISRFYTVVSDVTNFLIKMTPTPPRKQKNPNMHYNGCLEAPYFKSVPISFESSYSRNDLKKDPRGQILNEEERSSHSREIDIGERIGEIDLKPIQIPKLINTYLSPID